MKAKVAEFRSLVLHKAEFFTASGAPSLRKADILAAADEILSGAIGQNQKTRAFDVITRALYENRQAETAAQFMAVILFGFGLVLFLVAVCNSDAGTRISAMISGAAVEFLVVLPFTVIVNIRRHNLALRMLGLVLDRVEDPVKLAPLLKELLHSVVAGRSEKRGLRS